MTIQKRLFPGLLIALVIFLLATSGCTSVDKEDLSGVWVWKEDTLLIYRMGEKKNTYFISQNRYRVTLYTLNDRKDSLLLQYSDGDKRGFRINRKYDVLVDSSGNYGDTRRYKCVERKGDVFDLRDIKPSSNDFFDYSTTKAFIGNRYRDEGVIPALPFAINPDFIKKNGIDSIAVETFEKTITEHATSTDKTYDLTYVFNEQGRIGNFKAVIHSPLWGVTARARWDFVYRGNVVKQIVVHGSNRERDSSWTVAEPVIRIFDEEAWPVDKFGLKTSYSFMRDLWAFTYVDGLPAEARPPFMYGPDQPTAEFTYNDDHQLTSIEYGYSKRPSGRSTEFVYDEKGVLKTIIDVVDKR